MAQHGRTTALLGEWVVAAYDAAARAGANADQQAFVATHLMQAILAQSAFERAQRKLARHQPRRLLPLPA
jgi:hypothetical protein